MIKNPERIMREVLAAIVGSKLSVADMRALAELLERERFFSVELAHLLADVSYKLGKQEKFDWQEPAENRTSYGGLTDLAYSIVQRKRISKTKLFELFARFGVDRKRLDLERDMPVRELVNAFLEYASPSQLDQFMEYLGVEVGHDAYLGGIGQSGTR